MFNVRNWLPQLSNVAILPGASVTVLLMNSTFGGLRASTLELFKEDGPHLANRFFWMARDGIVRRKDQCAWDLEMMFHFLGCAEWWNHVLGEGWVINNEPSASDQSNLDNHLGSLEYSMVYCIIPGCIILLQSKWLTFIDFSWDCLCTYIFIYIYMFVLSRSIFSETQTLWDGNHGNHGNLRSLEKHGLFLDLCCHCRCGFTKLKHASYSRPKCLFGTSFYMDFGKDFEFWMPTSNSCEGDLDRSCGRLSLCHGRDLAES